MCIVIFALSNFIYNSFFLRKLLKGYKKYKQLLDKEGVNVPAALSHVLSDIGVGLVSDSCKLYI